MPPTEWVEEAEPEAPAEPTPEPEEAAPVILDLTPAASEQTHYIVINEPPPEPEPPASVAPVPVAPSPVTTIVAETPAAAVAQLVEQIATEQTGYTRDDLIALTLALTEALSD
jgi:hypothetical protein